MCGVTSSHQGPPTPWIINCWRSSCSTRRCLPRISLVLSTWAAEVLAQGPRRQQEGGRWAAARVTDWDTSQRSPGRLVQPMEAARGGARKAFEQIRDAMHSIDGAYSKFTCDHIQKYFFRKEPRVKNPKSKKPGQAGVLRWLDPTTLVGVAELISERGAELKRFLKEPEPQARAGSRGPQ